MAKKAKKGLSLLGTTQISKKYPGYIRASELATENMNGLRVPSRIIGLNHQLNGGIPYGKFLEEIGEESTGKSLLALDFGYCTQALGGVIIWADAENAFDDVWVKKNGIDLAGVELLTRCNTIETISDWSTDMCMFHRSRLIKNEPILLVVDSTAALDTLKNMEENSQMDKKAQYGNRAMKIYEMFRMRNTLWGQLGVTVIMINQLRKKMGATMFEDPDTTPGGAAAKYYASQRIHLVRGKQIKETVSGVKDVKTGQNVYIRTKKDKTGPPRDTTKAQVYFRDTKKHSIGFDKYFGLPELLVTKGILQRSKGSSIYKYMDKSLARGEEALYEILRGDDDLRAKLIRKSRVNTISRTRAQIDTITTNLFKLPKTKVEKQVTTEEL